MVKIAPSILSANFAKLGEEIQKLEQAGANMIHIDVMDGHFVPNLTIGPVVINSIRPYSKLPFDVHLMIANPEQHIEAYAKAGADIITVHLEASIHIDRTLKQIKDLGAKVGISLLPSTPPDSLDYLLDKIDLILVMTVNPGFGGQEFLPSQLQKIKLLKDKIQYGNREIMLAVDGGIKPQTAKQAIEAGADMLIAGSYIFKDADYQSRIQELKNA
jgi:ribulose-phosphate 3-epimerase